MFEKFVRLVKRFKLKRAIRLGELALLLAAIAGPWLYDTINVPAEYTCGKPFIRLEGDYCGTPMSGVFFLSMVLLGSIGALVQLVLNPLLLVERSHEMVRLFGMWLLIMPFFSTLLMVWKEDSRRRWIFHEAAWALAAVWIFLVFFLERGPKSDHLWGIWLYGELAAAVLLVEAAVLLVEVVGRRFLNRMDPG